MNCARGLFFKWRIGESNHKHACFVAEAVIVIGQFPVSGVFGKQESIPHFHCPGRFYPVAQKKLWIQASYVIIRRKQQIKSSGSGTLPGIVQRGFITLQSPKGTGLFTANTKANGINIKSYIQARQQAVLQKNSVEIKLRNEDESEATDEALNDPIQTSDES